MISVIIPIFNGFKHLLITLNSLAEQEYKDFETIIIDDGSTEKFDQKQLRDINLEHMVFQSVAHRGSNSARNIGFDMSKGEYLLFCDSDLLLKKEMLMKLWCALDNTSYAFSYCGFVRELSDGNPMPYTSMHYDRRLIQLTNYIPMPALIKRQHFVKFDEKIERLQDWDLWLTIIQNGGIPTYVPQMLFKSLHRPNSISNLGEPHRKHWEDIIKLKHNL